MVHVARLESENFSFEAYGETEPRAIEALVGGLRRHAREYGISADWFEGYEASVRPVRLGACYRDREDV